jgi:hypothetical protein
MEEHAERDEWIADAEQVFAEVRAWRAEHPTATWVEIQRAVEGGVQRLRERMLTDAAQASALTDFVQSGERPTCPACGGRLQARGHQTRRLLLDQGGAVSLNRTQGWCPRCRAGLFPPG